MEDQQSAIFYFIFQARTKTEHLKTDGEEQHGSKNLLIGYSFYIFYDSAQVKN